jgi:hypothetical protein
MLDQAGDVVFVFDDEDAVFGHQPRQAYRLNMTARCPRC